MPEHESLNLFASIQDRLDVFEDALKDIQKLLDIQSRLLERL
ncbi:MAG: hypothetical protein ACR2QW_03030 [bacterium]